MSKKNKIIIDLLILFLLGVVGICKFSFNSGYKISITNNTNKLVGLTNLDNDFIDLRRNDKLNIFSIEDILIKNRRIEYE